MAGYWRYTLASRLARCLPVSAGYALSELAAAVSWKVRPAQRRCVARNLRFVTGQSMQEFDPAVRRVFCNFGYYLFEFFSMHRLDKPDVAVEGLEHLEAAERAGRGVIILTAHLGNWELGAKVLQEMGRAVCALALIQAGPVFDDQRKRCGMEIIPIGRDAVKKALSALRNKRLLALLADRDFMGDGMRMRIGSGWLSIPRGPAVLSLRAQAPIVPMFLVREGCWRFKLICKPAIWPKVRGGDSRAANVLVEAYSRVLEEVLKRHGDHRLMFDPVLQPA